MSHQVFTHQMYIYTFVSCRNMDLGNTHGVEHQWCKDFSFLPWHRRIWKCWQVKRVRWQVMSWKDKFSSGDWTFTVFDWYFFADFFLVESVWLIRACVGFLLWQLFWVLSLYITCLKRLVTRHYPLLFVICLMAHWKASFLVLFWVERWISLVIPGLYLQAHIFPCCMLIALNLIIFLL